MKNLLFVLIAFATLTNWNCKKDKLADIDQINFGHSNVSWGPDCAYYQLTPTQLFTSTRSCDPRDTSQIVYDVLLPDQKFTIAKRLLHDLPEEFFNSPEDNFKTDCVDCGGYSIQIKKGDIIKTVVFSDVLNTEWPKYAQRTYGLLSEVMNDLR